ncbi:hypothetical protein JXQ70_02955 [bacterium]|nr:hypothetical protein [bacterium]
MVDYVIRAYQPGFEVEQAKIGYEVAQNWAWPYAHSLNDLLKIHVTGKNGGCMLRLWRTQYYC